VSRVDLPTSVRPIQGDEARAEAIGSAIGSCRARGIGLHTLKHEQPDPSPNVDVQSPQVPPPPSTLTLLETMEIANHWLGSGRTVELSDEVIADRVGELGVPAETWRPRLLVVSPGPENSTP